MCKLEKNEIIAEILAFNTAYQDDGRIVCAERRINTYKLRQVRVNGVYVLWQLNNGTLEMKKEKWGKQDMMNQLMASWADGNKMKLFKFCSLIPEDFKNIPSQ